MRGKELMLVRRKEEEEGRWQGKVRSLEGWGFARTEGAGKEKIGIQIACPRPKC